MIIPMLCVTIFVILVVWFLLPRVARLMIHTPTAISIFVCLSMVQLMAVFISMRCTLCGHFLQVAKFFACLVRFESSSVPTTLPTAYDVYPLDGRHDGGYYTVKDCVTIDVLPRTPGNNVYVGFMVWSNFTATKCRG